MPKNTAVQFDMLDKPRNLRFDMNAFADLEERLGIGPSQLFAEDRSGFSTIRGLVWAGLKWEDARLKIETVGALLQTYMEAGGELGDVMTEVAKALNASGMFKMDVTKDQTGDKDGEKSTEDAPDPNFMAEGPETIVKASGTSSSPSGVTKLVKRPLDLSPSNTKSSIA